MIWALLVAGAIGAVLRLLLDRRLPARTTTSASPWAGWPYGILLANAAGCLLLGAVISFARSHGLALQPVQWWSVEFKSATAWLLAAGFCGSLSTASTLFVGVDALFEVQRSRAPAYLSSTLIIGLLCGIAGIQLGALLA